MISTANSSFSARSGEVASISIDLIRINRMMQRHGPEVMLPTNGGQSDQTVVASSKASGAT